MLTLVLGLLAIALLHFAVLHRGGNITGVDYGNWLTFGHRFLGQGLSNGPLSTYPPLIPLTTVAAVAALGPLWGTNLLAAVIGCAPAIGIYIVLRRSGLQWTAAGIALVIAAARSSGEPIAWGGLPQLLGLGIGVLLLDEVVRLLKAPTAGGGWRAGVLALALGATSHLVFGQLGVTIAVATLLHVMLVRRGLTIQGPWFGRTGWLATASRIIIPSLVLVPLYVALLPALGVGAASGGQPEVSLSQALQQLNYVFADAPTLWKGAAVIAAISPLLLWPHRRTFLWIEGMSVTWTVFASTVLLRQDRFLYFLPLGIALALAAWAPELKVRCSLTPWAGQLAVVMLGVALAGWLIFVGLRQFPNEQHFYGSRLFPAQTVEDLSWLASSTPSDSVVAVPPAYGVPWGWWVEGFARRVALVGSSTDYLYFPRERKRAEQVDSLFSLTTATPEAVLRDAQHLGIDYLYIPSTWGGLRTTSVGGLLYRYPDRVLLENQGAVIISVRP